jgi:hypothetical protein
VHAREVTRQTDQLRGDIQRLLERAQRPGKQSFHLVAAVLCPQAPFAEVLAVVVEEVIAIFPNAGQRPLDDFGAAECRRALRNHEQRTALREPLYRHRLDRAGPQPTHEPCVVRD